MTASRQLNENLKPESIQKSNHKKPKKVIFCWNYLEWGGAQMYFLGIAGRIKDRAEVLCVFPRETGRQFLDFCENLQIPYRFLETADDLKPAPTLKRKLQRRWRKFRAAREMLKFLKKMDLTETALHIELAPWQSLFALVRLCRKTKVFITMHNRLPPAPAWRTRWWKLKFSIITRFRNFHIFASNEDTKESLKPFVSPKFLERVKVTYTNVNPDEIDEALRAELNREEVLENFELPKNKFLVFCVGQFIDRKGRWIFLEAARKLKEKSAQIAFVWISNSGLTAEEKKRIEEFALEDSFYLINSETIGREHLDLMKFLRLADCFTLPSFQEGLPISLLEAMALGIPSISTEVNAIPEALKNNETGILIEAGDASALAAAILKLREDGELRERLSAHGRRRVLTNFNEKLVAETALAAYRESFENNR